MHMVTILSRTHWGARRPSSTDCSCGAAGWALQDPLPTSPQLWALCPLTFSRAPAGSASQRLPHEGEQTEEDHTWGRSISPRPALQVRELRPERSRDPVKTSIRPRSELRAEIVRDALHNCHPTCLPLSLGLAFSRHFQSPNLRMHTHTPHPPQAELYL